MILGSTQPLVKMSAKNIPGGKGGRCVRLTTYHHTVRLSRNLGALTSLEPSGLARPFTGVLYLWVLLILLQVINFLFSLNQKGEIRLFGTMEPCLLL